MKATRWVKVFFVLFLFLSKDKIIPHSYIYINQTKEKLSNIDIFRVHNPEWHFPSFTDSLISLQNWT